jgi:predicted RNA-binding Zn-ribbon protein involved in translation (DUF1610 family)
MKEWLRKVMTGRYGVDQLSHALLILSIILMVLGAIFRVGILNNLAMIVLVLSYFRVFSKNINKRYQENMKFLNWWNPIKSKFYNFKNKIKQSKTHKFFKCPSCNKQLRVPRGKGKIKITCPNCHTKFEARS